MGNKPSGDLSAEEAAITQEERNQFQTDSKQQQLANKGNKKSHDTSNASQQDNNMSNVSNNSSTQSQQPEPQQQQQQSQQSQQSQQQQQSTTDMENDEAFDTIGDGILQRKVTLDDFELLSVIGKGSFGKVFSVKKKDCGRVYAMKVLKKEEILKRRQISHTLLERRILENIDHPFIVSLRYAFQTAEKLYFILDLFTGGELFFHLKTYGRFTEQMVVLYAAELLLALSALHQNNIIYRDLKPENILLDEDGHVRLTDFGLSKEIKDNGEIHTICGTPEYLAPELIKQQPYSFEVDYWSLGTLIYEMLVGIPPFYNNNLNTMYQRILQAPLQFPPGVMSPEAEHFITLLLDRNPQTRGGSGGQAGVERLKQHPWFQLFGLDFGAVYAKHIIPPFRPNSDRLNVDEEFTQESAVDTPCVGSTILDGKTKVKFPQFSYQSPDDQGMF